MKLTYDELKQEIDKMDSFIDINKELPKHTQEVEVIIKGNICKCMYYHEIIIGIFPNGWFGTYYRMLIENVTHWRNCTNEYV
jgi:hypothetical protein